MAYRDLPLTPTPQFDATCLSQVNQLFADVHIMLRLPIRDVEGLETSGCNLASALTLMDIASGVSRVLSNDPNGRRDSGTLFTDFFRDHYPWDEEPTTPVFGFQAVTGASAAEALYDSYRNPLAHRLGTVDAAQLFGRIKVAKSPLTEQQISDWEAMTTRPVDEAPTLGDETGANPRRVLNVPLLYWGLRKAICTAVTRRGAQQAVLPQAAAPVVQTHYVPTITTIGSMAILPPGTFRIP